MSRQEKRAWLIGNSEAFGNAEFERIELEKLQEGPEETELTTISVGCGGLLTVICC